MKKDTLFYGMIFLGIALIVSSLILSGAIRQGNQLYGDLTGNLSGSFTSTSADAIYTENINGINKDILIAAEAGALLGYQREDLINAIIKDELEGIPYTKLGSEYIFSRKALEEWVYKSSTK